jgi:hypothetical protein
MQRNNDEIRKFVKETVAKVKKENTTANVGGYLTPKAFVGDSDAEGSAKAIDASTAYNVKPPKKKKFFIGYKDQGVHLSDIKEANYRQFKEDASMPQYKKINQAVLEINRKINEINTLLKHSAKLKTEAQVGDEKLWKKTNEALLKIHKRLAEASTSIKKFANLKEIEQKALQDKLIKLFQLANMRVTNNDIEIAKSGNVYQIDVYINGEPYGFDVENDMLTYQGFDKEVLVGNLRQDQQVIDNLKKLL